MCPRSCILNIQKQGKLNNNGSAGMVSSYTGCHRLSQLFCIKQIGPQYNTINRYHFTTKNIPRRLFYCGDVQNDTRAWVRGLGNFDSGVYRRYPSLIPFIFKWHEKFAQACSRKEWINNRLSVNKIDALSSTDRILTNH